MATLVTDSGRKAPARLASSAILACQSDDRLVKLVREGHERAFETIVARYRKQLVQFSGRFLPESRTEDAVQQAFINAHAALLGSEDPVQLKPWLYTITRNAALNMVRQNGWNYEQIPADFDGVRRPDQVVEQRIELQRTVAAVSQLPDRQRDAIVMREFEGRSYGEIAVALGANDGAVRQLLNRARGTLRAAASMLTPPPLVARAAASLPPSDGRRLAEVFGSVGAAGIAKAGATALVAGSIVVGAVHAPLPLVSSSSHKVVRQKATLRADRTPQASVSAVSSPDAQSATGAHGKPADAGSRGHHGHGSAPGSHGHGQRSGPGHRSEHSGARHESGSGEHRSSSDGGSRHDSTSGEHHTSSGDGSHSGSDSTGSGSDDSTSSSGGSDGGSTGTSGSEDTSTLSGSDGSGSGTSGSGETTTSGSTDGSSGSTSGSDGSSTSGTSGSDGSTSGTSGTSGSSDSTSSTSDTSTDGH
jgi:RNA polymerase sigma factor (sigma-70 family)